MSAGFVMCKLLTVCMLERPEHRGVTWSSVLCMLAQVPALRDNAVEEPTIAISGTGDNYDVLAENGELVSAACCRTFRHGSRFLFCRATFATRLKRLNQLQK